jgi:predicted dehydrogenase
VLFEYPTAPETPERARKAVDRQDDTRRRTRTAGVANRVRIAFIGAGNYASSILLPRLATSESIELAHVVTTTSLSAVNAQRKFGFSRASTDVGGVLDDASIDAVFVITRHHSHAEMTCMALEAGKSVYVEKPLALSIDELDRILKVIERTGNDRLMVGFNRRFAPMLVDLRARFGSTGNGAIAHYYVNAGALPKTSWYRDYRFEGTRFEGEGGHFIDTLSWWLDAPPSEVYGVSTDEVDDLVITIRFADGSLANISYLTNGNVRYPKETFQVASQGRMARLDNFRRATVWNGRRRHVKRAIGPIDKGQTEQLRRFIAAVRSGGPMPIALDSLVATTKATLLIGRSATTGVAEPV